MILVLKGGRGRNPRSLVKFCRQNCATYFYSLFFASLTSSRVIDLLTLLYLQHANNYVELNTVEDKTTHNKEGGQCIECIVVGKAYGVTMLLNIIFNTTS